MAKKSTNIEIDERINTVYKLLLEGNSRTQILQYGADTWDLKDRQVEEYIKRARDYQRLDAELERPEWLHESLSALKDIQRKATTRQQYSTALKAIEMQARLLRFEMS
jgi:cell fate (sporulation/competence/biofilm development) regulator YmcA (YheA/YmcA/DUF963 family)|tara:strand:- start:799 stop:1122 length:324 start_codon:yes stop_codon:yes gene_type:complete